MRNRNKTGREERREEERKKEKNYQLIMVATF